MNPLELTAADRAALLELTDAERMARWAGCDPVFTEGQQVICLNADGYHCLKRGEIYKVVGYSPRNPMPTFTWPAYVDVEVNGRSVGCHATRFKALPTAHE